MSTTLITTPIFYVNSRPHLGHAFSMLVSDAQARWLRKSNNLIKFSTGTDEHGQKVKPCTWIIKFDYLLDMASGSKE